MKTKPTKLINVISNIDPINGVTPHQLIKYCNEAVKAFKNRFYLTDDEIQTAINDTVVGVYQRMQEGLVNKTDFMLFKDFVFIGLKNNITNQNNKKQSIYATRTSFIIDDADYSFDAVESNADSDTDEHDANIAEMKEIMYQAIKLLSPRLQKVFAVMLTKKLKQGDLKITLDKYGVTKTQYFKARQTLKDIIESKKYTQEYIQDKKKKKQQAKARKTKIKHLNQLTTEHRKILKTFSILEEKITYLKENGYTHNAIATILSCSKSTVSYFTNPEGQAKAKARNKRNKQMKKKQK